jgi:2,4-dienoyl-CoA reductase-like NADH-dependent reductase (Old Yellow Enzyme family)/thioredoxin reductase
MKNKLKHSKLFEPAKIGNVKLRNRLVMLPMGTAYANAAGEVTQRTIDHYVERAKGGVGLITVGNISPHYPNALNQLVLDSDWFLMGHYELVEKVHAQGAKINAQLNCPGRQKYPDALRPGEELVSSSALPTRFLGKIYPTPKPLSKHDIYISIERYVKAAERAKRVGYDMVELHGAHGYLINQFMSPFMNSRTDEFGGSLENRMRFALELIEAMRQSLGQDFPIGFRLSADEFVPGGITLEESPAIAQMLEGAGVAYISVSGAVFESLHKYVCLMRDPEGWKKYLWEAIKKVVKVPIIGGGGLRRPDFCERLLGERKMDFVGLARPLLADPQWPVKAMEGRVEDIRLCISCNECLYGSARRRQGGGARRCAVNAASGREREFAEVIPAPAPKKVMIIGGGPGGMEAARIAAMRGHKVILYDKGQTLGGQLLLAGKPQSKKKVLYFRDYLVNQLRKMDVKVELGIKVTPELVQELKPDAVVVATGAEPITPDIPGIDGKKVVSAWNLLEDKVKPEKEKVVVIGGGIVGSEVADYLLEKQNTVIIIEQLPSIASDMEPTNRAGMMERFVERDVSILTGRKVASISEKGVQVVNLDNGQAESVDGDRIVIAMGARPVGALKEALEGRVPELHAAGDCNQPRVIIEAVYEGSLVGRQI